jgi:two-component system OmpR family sensor kinase
MASRSRTEATGGSLVKRLTIGLTVAVTILGSTVASLAVWRYWRTTIDQVDHRLRLAAQDLAARIVVTNGLLEIEAGPATALEAEDAGERYLAVYDADGGLLYGSSQLAPERFDGAVGTRSRDEFREAIVAGPNESVIVAAESLDPVNADIGRLAASLAIATLVGAALTLPVAAWLRRQLGRSLRHIDQTARALAPGQPLRIDESSVADEFSGVAGALNSAFDRLDEALARERQITSDASHELRTPATTLLAEARWALDRPRDADTYRRSLEVCVRQAVRMRDLVESMLTLARLEAGSMPPDRTPVRLGPLLEETIAELEPLGREHEVTIEGPLGDGTVAADATQVRILVTNLVTNAIRYNRQGGRVAVRINGRPEGATIEVEDTGAGLEPALASRVFERFWRADPGRSSRASGGSGLGLAIVKAIVDAHDGRISVHSTVGQGTTFRVDLGAS